MPAIASSPSDISDNVRSFLTESFLSDREFELGDDEELMTVLDSLQLLRMVMQLESVYRISVDYSELTLENLGTVRRIGMFVNNKLNQ